MYKLICSGTDGIAEEIHRGLTAEEAVDMAEVKLDDYDEILIKAEY